MIFGRRPVKTGVVVGLGAAVLSLSLSACGSGGTSGAADGGVESMRLRLSIPTAKDQEAGRVFVKYAEAVTEASGGKITFEVFPNSSLLTVDKALGATSAGVADISYASLTYFPQELPITNWMSNLSMAASSYPIGMMEGTGALMQSVTSSKEVQKEFADNGVHLMFEYMGFTPTSLICNKPIETLKDAEGLRVRTPSEMAAGEVKSIGGVPVQLPPQEFYESLQRGVVDCNYLHPTTATALSLWDVAKHYTPVQFAGYNSSAMLFNKATWDKMSPETQKIFNNAVSVAAEEAVKVQLESYAKFATTGADEDKVTFHDPRELDKVIKAHQTKVLASLADEAPKTLSDPSGFIKDFLANSAMWKEKLQQDMGWTPSERTPEAIRQSFIDAAKLDISAYGEMYKTEIAEQ